MKLIEQFERGAPFDLDAERSLLGAMFLGDSADVAELRTLVDSADFFQRDHQIYFDSICRLVDVGKGADAVTVRAYLAENDLLVATGGAAALGGILNFVPHAAHGPHYAGIVKNLSRRRRIIEVCNHMLKRAYEPQPDDSADRIIEYAQRSFAEISADGRAAEFCKLGEAAQAVYDDMSKNEEPLMTTGIGALDAQVGGIAAGEMLILAARPSMGKSTLARCMALGMAEAGIPVAFISLEESQRKIARNLLSAVALVENGQLRRGQKFITQQAWENIAIGVNQLSGLPFYVCDRARRLRDVRAMASMLVNRFGCKVVFVDYLQRVHADGKDRFEKTTNASLGLSDLFKDLDVAGVVLSQLNRDLGRREDKRPTMFDLRESGQIEQDADGIVMLHREDYYRLDDGAYQPTRIAELIIAKWRDSTRGNVVKLRSDLKYQRFTEEFPA